MAVADFARQIFERFDDKHALVIGAGEMAEETLRYLRDEGDPAGHGRQPALRPGGRTGRPLGRPGRRRGTNLPQSLAAADLVVSTTGAAEPIVTAEQFAEVEALRFERPLLILDLAVPRDFEPAIGDRPDVYLYSIDDLQAACQRNRAERDQELPAAMHIVEQETARFMAEMCHHAVGPVIERLRQGWQKPKEEELERLLNKLPELDDRATRGDPPLVRPAGEQAVAPAAGIAPRRIARGRSPRAVGRAGEAVPVEGLIRGMLVLPRYIRGKWGLAPNPQVKTPRKSVIVRCLSPFFTGFPFFRVVLPKNRLATIFPLDNLLAIQYVMASNNGSEPVGGLGDGHGSDRPRTGGPEGLVARRRGHGAGHL